MKTETYYIDNTREALEAVHEIKKCSPCWVDIDYTTSATTAEVSIRAMEWEFPFIERTLAPFV